MFLADSWVGWMEILQLRSDILDFQMFELLTATLLWGVNMRHCATFRSAQSNCCGDMAIFHFLRWQPSAILDLYYVYLDHHQRVLVGLCQCAIFGWNRCSSFE